MKLFKRKLGIAISMSLILMSITIAALIIVVHGIEIMKEDRFLMGAFMACSGPAVLWLISKLCQRYINIPIMQLLAMHDMPISKNQKHILDSLSESMRYWLSIPTIILISAIITGVFVIIPEVMKATFAITDSRMSLSSSLLIAAEFVIIFKITENISIDLKTVHTQ